MNSMLELNEYKKFKKLKVKKIEDIMKLNTKIYSELKKI